MPVSIPRQCPHCQTSFLAQRGDKFFCQHSCVLAFDYWLRSRHNGAKRTAQLIEAYRTHRTYQGQQEGRRVALEAQVQ